MRLNFLSSAFEFPILREPGVTLERDGQAVPLHDWACEIVAACAPIADALDAADSANPGGSLYAQALQAACDALAAPHTLPSARVLQAMQSDFGGSHIGFVGAQSEQTRIALLALPFGAGQQARFEQMAQRSVAEQRAIEAADSVDFETFRRGYLAPEGLLVRDDAVAV